MSAHFYIHRGLHLLSNLTSSLGGFINSFAFGGELPYFEVLCHFPTMVTLTKIVKVSRIINFDQQIEFFKEIAPFKHAIYAVQSLSGFVFLIFCLKRHIHYSR